MGFGALAAESSEYTKTSSESPGAIAVNPQPPPLGLLCADAGIGDSLVFWSWGEGLSFLWLQMPLS